MPQRFRVMRQPARRQGVADPVKSREQQQSQKPGIEPTEAGGRSWITLPATALKQRGEQEQQRQVCPQTGAETKKPPVHRPQQLQPQLADNAG